MGPKIWLPTQQYRVVFNTGLVKARRGDKMRASRSSNSREVKPSCVSGVAPTSVQDVCACSVSAAQPVAGGRQADRGRGGHRDQAGSFGKNSVPSSSYRTSCPGFSRRPTRSGPRGGLGRSRMLSYLLTMCYLMSTRSAEPAAAATETEGRHQLLTPLCCVAHSVGAGSRC